MDERLIRAFLWPVTRDVSALTVGSCCEEQEVAHPERTAFAVCRNAKAFRSWIAGEARLVLIAWHDQISWPDLTARQSPGEVANRWGA